MINIKNYFKNKKKNYLDEIDQCILSSNESKEILENMIENKSTNKIISEEFLYDLEILKGNYEKYENSILYKIDNTLTNIGHIYLKNIFLNPLDNIKYLKERQKIINNISISKKFNKIK